MSDYNIYDLYRENLKSGKPFFGPGVLVLDFMNDYATSFKDLDRKFARTKSIFAPIWQSETIADTLADFQADVFSLLKTHENDLRRLFQASKIEYKPIENYRMTESSDDNTTNINKVINQYGNKSTNNKYGVTNKTNTETLDTTDLNTKNLTETENVGNVSATDVLGSKTDNNTKSQSGYNQAGFTDTDKQTSEQGVQTNTHTENGKVNTTNNTGTDTITKTGTNTYAETQNEHTDTESIQKDNDIEDQNGTTAVKHTLSRSGNIGVTTSQRMLQSEIDLWNEYNFYDKITQMIILELLHFDDDGYDVFLTPTQNQYF